MLQRAAMPLFIIGQETSEEAFAIIKSHVNSIARIAKGGGCKTYVYSELGCVSEHPFIDATDRAAGLIKW
jgi:hypothetical protein